MVYVEMILEGKILRGAPFTFFVKKVVRGNAVQIFSNFPAKSLILTLAFY